MRKQSIQKYERFNKVQGERKKMGKRGEKKMHTAINRVIVFIGHS